MKIGGVRPCSLIDYPGSPAVVIFTAGCTFRCWYCHNPQLVLPEYLNHDITADELWTFLQRRRAVLDAVVITGGEPTFHRDLPSYITNIRRLGYRVKLDTNGSNPAMLENLIARACVDHLAMDVKAPLERYADITGVPVDTNAILRSIQLIRESGVPHTFRLTYASGAGFPFEPAAVQHLIGRDEPLCIQPFRRPPDGSPLLSDLINQNQPSDTTTIDRQSPSHLATLTPMDRLRLHSSQGTPRTETNS